MRAIVLGILLLALGAALLMITQNLSHIGTPPDPNDPRQAGVISAGVLRQQLRGISDSLVAREQRREITKEQFDDYMAKAANGLLDQVKLDKIEPKNAWEYGELFTTARRWRDAKAAYEVAVKAAKNEDRRVNDNLRLARSMAELGEVPEAVRTARKTFDTPDEAAAPILPATLLEIVPAAENKGHDAELAGLLEEAIRCEARTIVDPKSPPGRDFLMARPHHIRHAWEKAIDLYTAAGSKAKAAEAVAKMQAMLKQQSGA